MPGFPRGGGEGEAGGLDAWADHVSGGRDAYKCYHPRDVQFRFVVGAGDALAPEAPSLNAGAPPRAGPSTRTSPWSASSARTARASASSAGSAIDGRRRPTAAAARRPPSPRSSTRTG
ncbi:hypothetical protein SO694_00028122 [Aureococcus anophagefferens]|uniref:DUF72 domain-containing protein n=1 Tax=Aureococcus anophagefferens TaxID=44056 RepID=A0ABR1FVN6_AURAN